MMGEIDITQSKQTADSVTLHIGAQKGLRRQRKLKLNFRHSRERVITIGIF